MGDLFSGGQQAGYEDLERALREAQGPITQYYQQARAGLAPYMAAGERGLGRYETGLGAMADPQRFYQQMTSGYQMSPMAQQELAQAKQAAQYGGLAGGMTGASARKMAQYAQQLSGRDINDYYNRMAGTYGQYLGGQAGLAETGRGAATQVGEWGMRTGSSLADLMAQRGQAQYGEDVARQSGIGGALGAGLGILGGMFGGPAGAGLGGMFGRMFGGGGFGGLGMQPGQYLQYGGPQWAGQTTYQQQPY